MKVMLYKTDLMMETLIKILEELDPTIQNRIEWNMFIDDLKRQLIHRKKEAMKPDELKWTFEFVLHHAKKSGYIISPINGRELSLCQENSSLAFSIFISTVKIIACDWFLRYYAMEEKIQAEEKEKVRIQRERERFCCSCSRARCNSKGELLYTEPCQACYHNTKLTEHYMARRSIEGECGDD